MFACEETSEVKVDDVLVFELRGLLGVFFILQEMLICRCTRSCVSFDEPLRWCKASFRCSGCPCQTVPVLDWAPELPKTEEMRLSVEAAES